MHTNRLLLIFLLVFDTFASLMQGWTNLRSVYSDRQGAGGSCSICHALPSVRHTQNEGYTIMIVVFIFLSICMCVSEDAIVSLWAGRRAALQTRHSRSSQQRATHQEHLR
jgi:hypothetical protein